MPIYAYKCGSCGHAKDVLQKLSDDPLTDCPACGASSFSKQVTAAGFQLKGSGWYATDFRNGSSGGEKAADAKTEATPADAKTSDAKPADAKPADSGTTKSAPAPASTSTAKSDGPSASAGGCRASCACH
jgi:putative FmdB family regulatory protein